MALIKAIGSTSYTTVPDDVVAAALMNPANNYKQDNILRIGDSQYQFNTLIMGGQSASAVVSIGTLSYTEVNAGAVAATFSKTFAGAIPSGKVLTRLYGKVVAFVSPTRNIEVSGLSTNLQVTGANALVSTQNLYYGDVGSAALKMNTAGDLTLNYVFTGGGNNPKDFTAGSLEVFVELIDAPTL